jgi:hypothetical protein
MVIDHTYPLLLLQWFWCLLLSQIQAKKVEFSDGVGSESQYTCLDANGAADFAAACVSVLDEVA